MWLVSWDRRIVRIERRGFRWLGLGLGNANCYSGACGIETLLCMSGGGGGGGGGSSVRLWNLECRLKVEREGGREDMG